MEGASAATILSVTANGYGKRTEVSEYRVQSRGGKGIITIKATERNGAGGGGPAGRRGRLGHAHHQPRHAHPDAGGGQISLIGRNTQGVRLITVESREEQVAGVARVAENVAVAGEGGEAPGEPAGDAAGEAPEGGDGSPEGEPA